MRIGYDDWDYDRFFPIMKPHKLKSRSFGFTLAELIVVIAILAILATIGFLALSWYSQDAKRSAVAANARSILSTVSSQSAIYGVSPRNYIIHDSASALSGASLSIWGQTYFLSGWNWNSADTNYSAGKPDFSALKLDPKKFGRLEWTTSAAYAAEVPAYSAWSFWYQENLANGKIRMRSHTQVVGTTPEGNAVVVGDYPTGIPGNPTWLVRNPNDPTGTSGIVDWQSLEEIMSSAPTGDPHISNVLLLAHLDDSTTDSAWHVTAWSTPFMNYSSTEKKFGTHAFHSPDNSGYNLKKYSDSAFSFWTSTDFTVEGWFKLSTNVTKHSIFCLGDSGDYGTNSSLSVYYTNTWSLVVRPAGSAFGTNDSVIRGTVPLNQWTHVALTREWSNLRLFVDGNQVWSTYAGTVDVNRNAIAFFSYNSANNPFLWYADELRVTRSVARYVTNFTPPSTEFPAQ